MAARLEEMYAVGTAVEILLDEIWKTGVVIRHEKPAVWVQTTDGRDWFVTNRQRIRIREMRPEVVDKLLAINRQFYEQQAGEFSQTRQGINPGFEKLNEKLPQPCPRLLDVGCGNGRLGQYLLQQQAVGEYVGVDFSSSLLDIAAGQVPGQFYGRDLSQPNCLDGLGQFEAVACLAVLHHIPGRTNRIQLLTTMGNCLTSDGRLFMSTWQFADNPRQQRKIRPWAEVDLRPADVEPDDYLLTWQRGDFAYRYACHIDATEIGDLAAAAGLIVQEQFRSDGREGDLGLYTIMRKQAV